MQANDLIGKLLKLDETVKLALKMYEIKATQIWINILIVKNLI